MSKPCYSRPFMSLNRVAIHGHGIKFSSLRRFSVLFQTKFQYEENELKSGAHSSKLRDKINERDFFLSVLSATATKRDARLYLSRYNPSQTNRAPSPTAHELQHVALVKIAAIQDIEVDVLIGLAHTFAQLERLGLRCVIVLDDNRHPAATADGRNLQKIFGAQADRLVSYLEQHASLDAGRLEHVLSLSRNQQKLASTVQVQGHVEVEHGDILARFLAKGKVPVFAPFAYTHASQHLVEVQADDIVLALTRHFSRLNTSTTKTRNTDKNASGDRLFPLMQLERIIVLDPQGGLPSATRADRSHVFINLEQEYREVRQELTDMALSSNRPASGATAASASKHSVLGASNPLTKLVEDEIILPDRQDAPQPSSYPQAPFKRHVENLDLLQQSLALLPPSSAALLTTPQQAATLTSSQNLAQTRFGVSTRSPRNPLIHNLLTDKPVISSSLPVSRLNSASAISPSGVPPTVPVTLVKKGMPLTMIPYPPNEGWQPPNPKSEPLSLNDPRIDLSRLMDLMEDSFNRKLEVSHYLSRIRNKLAGIIVAGEYEGAAILTWELPPGVPDDGSEASTQRMVPYLDKFAVLKRSQGAGGVADILFTAMVRRCFPNGVCWRSRKNNPVNKWYFERSSGTWKLPESDWAMFWTTPLLHENAQKMSDYEGVCRNIESSWADAT